MNSEYAAATAFVDWLTKQAILDARGDQYSALPVAPRGRLWLGRVAPEIKVRQNPLGARAERLEPCEIGIRVRLDEVDGRTVSCRARMVAWYQLDPSDDPDAEKWKKTAPADALIEIATPTRLGEITMAGRETLAAALANVGATGLLAEVHAELEAGKDGPELVITLVNVSPETIDGLEAVKDLRSNG